MLRIDRNLELFDYYQPGEFKTLEEALQLEEEKFEKSYIALKELCSGTNCSGYRGDLMFTHSGKMCQRWDVKIPHEHPNTPSAKPNAGLEENYCRNPDDEPTIWCYTTDVNTRWEACESDEKSSTYSKVIKLDTKSVTIYASNLQNQKQNSTFKVTVFSSSKEEAKRIAAEKEARRVEAAEEDAKRVAAAREEARFAALDAALALEAAEEEARKVAKEVEAKLAAEQDAELASELPPGFAAKLGFSPDDIEAAKLIVKPAEPTDEPAAEPDAKPTEEDQVKPKLTDPNQKVTILGYQKLDLIPFYEKITYQISGASILFVILSAGAYCYIRSRNSSVPSENVNLQNQD